MPEAMRIPGQPVTPGKDSTGYLPGEWHVTPAGEMAYSIPLDVPQGRAGMQPRVSLEYSSSAGAGEAGVGWSVAGAMSSITRCPAQLSDGAKAPHGVHYGWSDQFCLDGKRLVQLGAAGGAVPKANAEFRVERDGFDKVVSQTDPANVKQETGGPDKFTVQLKDGRVRTYLAHTGIRASSKVYREKQKNTSPVPNQPPPPDEWRTPMAKSTPRVIWLLDTEADRSGNLVKYRYHTSSDATAGNSYLPHRIEYTSHSKKGSPELSAHRSVAFEYEDRSDTSFSFSGGVKFAQTKRLKHISMFAPNPAATELVWRYSLGYTTSPSQRSLLSSVKKCGKSGSGCLRAKTFGWDSARDTNPIPSFTTRDIGPASGQQPPSVTVMDLDGDGSDDALIGSPTGAKEVRFGARSNQGGVAPLSWVYSLQNDPVWPAGFSGNRPFDLKGDGAVSLLVADGSKGNVKSKVLTWDRNQTRFADTGITVDSYAGNELLADFNGDGLLDLLAQNPTSGTYMVRINTAGSFGPPMATMLNSICPGTVVDPNGEGKASFSGQQREIAGNCLGDIAVLSLDENGQPGLQPGSSGADINRTAYRVMHPKLAGGDYRTVPGDFNGDHVEDFLMLPVMPKGSGWTQKAVLLWGTGDGLMATSVSGQLDTIPHDKYATVQSADVNNDGRSDLVAFDTTGTYTLISFGDGRFSDSGTSKIAADGGILVNNTGRPSSNVGDFNGDGRADILRAEGGRLTLLVQGATPEDKLTAVRDEGTAWDRQHVTYSKVWTDHLETPPGACVYPLHCDRRGMTVVRRVDSRDHVADQASAAPYIMEYAFEDPVFETRGQGFLGFSSMRTWDKQRPMETEYTYKHRTRVNNRLHPYTGMPDVVTTAVPILDSDDARREPKTPVKARVTRTHQNYELRYLNKTATPDTYAVFPENGYTAEWEQNVSIVWDSLVGTNVPSHITGISEPSTPLKRTDFTASHDDYGNQWKSTSAVKGGSSETVRTDYDPSPDRVQDWLTGLPTKHSVTSTPANGMPAVTRITERHFDDLGRLDTVWQQMGFNDALAETTTYGIDDLGVVRKETRSAAGLPDKVTRTEYKPLLPGQPDEEIYPSQVWSQRDKAKYRPSTWNAVWPSLGVTVATQNADGVQSATQFDELGRPVHIAPDGQTPTSITYSNRPDTAGGTNGTTTVSVTGPHTSKASTDATGRSLETRATGFDGTLQLQSQTRYDTLGRTARTTLPAPGGTTQYAYDSLDRPTLTTLPDGKTTTSTHTFFTSRTVSPTGAATTTTTNQDGQVKSVVKGHTDPSRSRAITTSYDYGPFGLLRTAADHKNNVTTYGYDIRGRTISIDDPNKGLTSTTYYGTGEVKTQTRSGNKTTTYADYDDLGRYTTKTTSEDGTSTFEYDTAANGIGKLAKATSPDNIRTEYRYDSNGRDTGTDYTDLSTNTTYSTDQTYDSQGRPDTLYYPQSPGRSRYAVKNGYNNAGNLATISEAAAVKPLWTVTARHANQALETAQYGATNGPLTLKNTYQTSGTGRLHNTTVTTPTTAAQNLTYTYYDDGLVHTKTDSVNKRTETYAYDSIQQLTDWDVTSGTATKSTDYAYDTLSNLESIKAGGTPTHTFQHGQNGAGPNVRTTTQPAGKPAQSNTWDTQGRITGGNGRTTTYTSFDLPKKITKDGVTTTYRYDAFGTKIVETTPTGSTLYVPGLYEHRTSTKNGITKAAHVFYLNSPDGPIGQATYNGTVTEVEYTLTDPLGSTTAVTNSAGVIQNRLFTDPFGNAIKADNTPAPLEPANGVTRQFTGHETDTTAGLINMKGRVYDPQAQLFLTPDPLATPADNPYTYVHNSPLNRTDPTGYRDSWGNGFSTGGTNGSSGSSGFDEFLAAGNAYASGGHAGLSTHSQNALQNSTTLQWYNRTIEGKLPARSDAHGLAIPKLKAKNNLGWCRSTLECYSGELLAWGDLGPCDKQCQEDSRNRGAVVTMSAGLSVFLGGAIIRMGYQILAGAGLLGAGEAVVVTEGATATCAANPEKCQQTAQKVANAVQEVQVHLPMVQGHSERLARVIERTDGVHGAVAAELDQAINRVFTLQEALLNLESEMARIDPIPGSHLSEWASSLGYESMEAFWKYHGQVQAAIAATKKLIEK
ncbi:RHS repeat-associated core domain-containing protein [Streptomyces sp. SCSIO 30461]|uniref:RHS repeat-associated core domain-containing protein n=1 Tax=Streptomyces sp. SCSIO 30461 TaxID=3118085 RepID=UPI0030D473B0